jgi:hypothetical protein
MKPERTKREPETQPGREAERREPEIQSEPEIMQMEQEGPSFSTLMLQLGDVAEGGSMQPIRATMTALMPRDETGARAMVARIARLKLAVEQLHNLALEMAFSER